MYASEVKVIMDFTSQEYAEMHFVYGFCNGNALAARREYEARYPHRRIPSSAVFTRLHQRLMESGKVHKQPHEVGHPIHDVGTEEVVLNMVENEPGISTREVAREIGVSNWKVWDVLRKNNKCAFHLNPVQALQETDYGPRVQFCRWLLNSDMEQYGFFKKILWTDESVFTREGVLNTHNMHYWSEQNPRATRERSFQRRFRVNVWAGVFGDQLIGPYIFEESLTGERYLQFLQHTLPTLLDGVDINRREAIVFQHDGAPPHFTNEVRDWLSLNYPTWIGRGGPVAWPARSPDLTPLDFFVWGFLKNKVYSTAVNSEQELRDRITAAVENLRQELSFKVTVAAMRKRSRACIRNQGKQFEHEL